MVKSFRYTCWIFSNGVMGRSENGNGEVSLLDGSKNSKSQRVAAEATGIGNRRTVWTVMEEILVFFSEKEVSFSDTADICIVNSRRKTLNTFQKQVEQTVSYWSRWPRAWIPDFLSIRNEIFKLSVTELKCSKKTNIFFSGSWIGVNNPERYPFDFGFFNYKRFCSEKNLWVSLSKISVCWNFSGLNDKVQT